MNAIQKNTPNTIEDIFSARNQDVARLLPQGCGMDAPRFARFAIAATKTQALRDCTAASIFEASLESAALGLPIGGSQALAYLVPYGSTAQFQLGYRGMVELLRRSGSIVRGEVRAVFEGDEFEYEFGLTPRLVHRPKGNTDPNKLTHTYFIAHFADGSTQFDVMTVDEILAVREFSKAKNASAWSSSFAEMAKKCVVRRLCKMLPMTPEIQEAVTRDDERFSTIDAKATVINSARAPELPNVVTESIEIPREQVESVPAQRTPVDDFEEKFAKCATKEDLTALCKDVGSVGLSNDRRLVAAWKSANARIGAAK